MLLISPENRKMREGLKNFACTSPMDSNAKISRWSSFRPFQILWGVWRFDFSRTFLKGCMTRTHDRQIIGRVNGTRLAYRGRLGKFEG